MALSKEESKKYFLALVYIEDNRNLTVCPVCSGEFGKAIIVQGGSELALSLGFF